MSKKICKIIIATIMLMILGITELSEGSIVAMSKQEDSIASVQDNVEYQFNVLRKNKKEWKDSELVLKKVLFDSNQKVSAYLYNVKKNKQIEGYIIASSEENNNIIEFGDELFLDNASEKVEENFDVKKKKQKVYYLGGMSYAIGGNDNKDEKVLVDVSNNNIEKISEKEMCRMDSEVDKVSLSSPPDNSGDGFITNPGKYESGYDSSSSKNVKGYNITYKIMSELQSGGVCAPTAATNIMLYWYKRDSKKYKKLYYKSNWKTTFTKLRDYMKCKSKGGTLDKNVATGYSKFFDLVGVNNYTVKFHSGTNSGRKIVSEINNGRPCHLIVHDHYKYNDHSVVALGYKQYIYEHWYGDRYETYIRIADGWTNSPTRFVWGKCKGSWNYVTVNIK